MPAPKRVPVSRAKVGRPERPGEQRSVKPVTGYGRKATVQGRPGASVGGSTGRGGPKKGKKVGNVSGLTVSSTYAGGQLATGPRNDGTTPESVFQAVEQPKSFTAAPMPDLSNWFTPGPQNNPLTEAERASRTTTR